MSRRLRWVYISQHIHWRSQFFHRSRLSRILNQTSTCERDDFYTKGAFAGSHLERICETVSTQKSRHISNSFCSTQMGIQLASNMKADSFSFTKSSSECKSQYYIWYWPTARSLTAWNQFLLDRNQVVNFRKTRMRTNSLFDQKMKK